MITSCVIAEMVFSAFGIIVRSITEPGELGLVLVGSALASIEY